MTEPQQAVVEDPKASGEDATTEPKVDDKKKAKRASVKTADPVEKFSGDGAMFRAKLFGTAEVRESRGDAICVTAMSLLKAAVKSTGEHKQKVVIKINLTGIVLVDASNQQKLYEHPVNKISFIYQDPQDNRAFGYIVTEAAGRHVYFGIKTEKAAEQVILTLKHLFETVFSLKKKEAEMKGTPMAEPVTNGAEVKSDGGAENKDEQKPAETGGKTEESLIGGDAAESASEPKKELKSQDSQSHLLDLLDNLSFVEQTPPAATSQPSLSTNNAWNGQPSNNVMSSGWGNAVPTQSDPFVVQQTQPTNLFGQQQPTNLFAQQPQPFAQQPQPFAQQPQPFAQQPQPFAQPTYQQQQPQQQPSPFQPMTQNQPAFQPAATNSPFNSQPSMYNPAPAQSFPTNFPVFQQQAPAAAAPSPFAVSQTQQPAAQQPAAVQQSPFASDPFATNGFHTPSQPSVQAPVQAPAQPSTNPFASTGDQTFGILQPKPVPQPAAAPAAYTNNPAPNLFSDLNPLPTDTSNVRKDQFFSEVKNPPKPKLSEMPMTKTMPPEGTTNNKLFSLAPNNSNQIPAASQHDSANLVWLNQQESGQQPAAAIANDHAKQSLISPPPRNLRQRQGMQGPAQVSRP